MDQALLTASTWITSGDQGDQGAAGPPGPPGPPGFPGIPATSPSLHACPAICDKFCVGFSPKLNYCKKVSNPCEKSAYERQGEHYAKKSLIITK